MMLTPEGKIEYVKQIILDKVAISPSGPLYIDLHPIVDSDLWGNILDDAPIILSQADQWSIIKKLEEEGFVQNIRLDKAKKHRVWLELTKDSEQQKIEKELGKVEKTLENADLTEKSFTRVENGFGYFKFYKEGTNIKVGKENTRQFKLLRCLTEPNFGIQKTVEAVFEAIKQPKDDDDSRLSGLASPQRKTRMLEIIEYTKKELQKNKELQGKINYCMDRKKQNMWLE